ncbi:MAG: hypothetical protein Q7S84_00390, partial [bacterium]|nr:hypothetical protein [bacterium]
MRRRFCTISLVIIGVLLAGTPAPKVSAYEIDTHAYLTHAVFDLYNAQFPDRKIPAELEPYLLDGSRREDDNERPMNHFYDPIHDVGLHTPVLGTWAKSKDWANDADNQTSVKYRVSATIASILSAIQERKLSLVSDDTDFTWREAIRAWVNGEKEKAMFTLGHVLHLMEDASVPEHTRNDPHPKYSPYESWTKQFTLFNQDSAFTGRLAGKQALTFGTLGSAFDSMAKYSNGGFLSEDTINKVEFIKPKENYLKIDDSGRMYGMKVDTEFGDYRLFQKELGDLLGKTYSQNEGKFIFSKQAGGDVIISDYWSRLSVRAVQHGAGLVRLFFEEANRAAQDPAFVREKNPSFLVRVVDNLGRFMGVVVTTANEFAGSVRDNMT